MSILGFATNHQFVICMLSPDFYLSEDIGELFRCPP